MFFSNSKTFQNFSKTFQFQSLKFFLKYQQFVRIATNIISVSGMGINKIYADTFKQKKLVAAGQVLF